MARGQDIENTPGAPLRRNPFRTEIVSKKESDKKSEEEAREKAQWGEVVGRAGDSLFYLEDGVVYKTRNAQGYDCYELLDSQGKEFFYETEEGLESGSRPTIVRDKETDEGSEKEEIWLKRYLANYQEEYRRELRNKAGNLHSPDPETPALVLKRYKGNSVVRETSFFDDGVLLKKIVYKYAAFSETGAGDTIEVFDGNGDLHSFDGLPALFISRGDGHDVHEFYEHGRLGESGTGEYGVYEMGKKFFFKDEKEITEADDYIKRGHKKPPSQANPPSYSPIQRKATQITPEDIRARREELAREKNSSKA